MNPVCPYCESSLEISISTTTDLPPDEWHCSDCDRYWVETPTGLVEGRA